MVQHKVDFDNLEWLFPTPGVKHKFVDQDNLRLRLVEYSKEMTPHWCEKGHYGYVIRGEMEIEYTNEKKIYKSGDGIYIPGGPDHQHKGKILSDQVLIFFVENV